MTKLQRRLYSAILRLHPSGFRNQFGRDMARDFEDAVGERGFVALLSDASLSLVRQWKVRALSGPETEQLITDHPFLAGQYFVVDEGPALTAFDLARATLLSVLLFMSVGFATTQPNRGVFARFQKAQVKHDGGIDNGGDNPAEAIREHGPWEAPGDQELLPDSGDGAHDHSVVHLRQGRFPAGRNIQSASGGPPPVRSLAAALWQVALISGIVWLTSLLLRRNPGAVGKVFLATMGLLGIAASVTFGQSPVLHLRPQILHTAAPLPSFEVASIRLVKDGKYLSRQGGPDEIYVSGRTVRFLIGESFNLPPGSKDRLVGGPDWINTNEYQIDAKIEAPLAAAMQKMSKQARVEQMHLLMQSLFADRFKLKVHFETRELPVYELVVAKGGSMLIHAKDLPPVNPSQPFRPRNPDDLRGSLLIIPRGGPMFQMIAKGETLDQFANMLTPHPEIGGRPVINRTGLTGTYDFTLDWAREQEAGAATDAAGPGLFAALQRQLGLKLVPSKAQVEVIVIDRIELPSEN